METRARYLLVGLFALVVVAAGFLFVYWMENTAGVGKRSVYRVEFNESVAGLLLGSAVQFNGMRVGEVTSLDLNPADPRQVLATIAVAADTPVKSDTKVGLVFGGLTGVPEIALTGGSPDAPAPQSAGGEPPLLVAQPGSSVGWTDAARDAFAQVQSLISSNSETLGDAIANIDTFSEALAKNSGKLDGIVDGLARLAGAGGSKPTGTLTFAAPGDFAPAAAMPDKQLVIGRPSDPVALETARLLLQTGSTLAPTLPDVQWIDNAPLLLQAKLIESFENAGYAKVASDTAGVMGDYTVLIELRSFQIVAGDTPTATIDFTAKLTDSSNAIVAARRFQATAPLAAMDAQAASDAFGKAFADVAHRLIAWTLPLLT
jgi:phospholipid/cholesterol/gamma-HCH transport system substrate-binding protein